MRFLYTVLLYLLQPVIWVRLFLRGRKAPAYRKRWLERYGFCAGKVKPGGIVLHSVSVGETIAAIPLVRALRHNYPDLPITITTMTPTGSERVIATFGNDVSHVYLPYDLPCAINRFLKQVKPKLVVIMETELWPNLIHVLHKKKIPLIVANARLSERSANRYQKLAHASQTMMQEITLIAAQSEEDGNRFISLGLNPSHLSVTGSIKFDISVTPELATKITAMKHQWASNRLVWIAASTHDGEDEIILYTHKALLNQFPDLLLIIVPRHPERFAVVQELVEKYDFNYILRSKEQPPTVETQVVIGDTMGELMALYGIADVAFVGGSLVNHGGHNPLEPAAHRIPIIVGPHIFNFKDICHKLASAHGLKIVENPAMLTEQMQILLSDKTLRDDMGKHANDVLFQNQGALEKQLKLIMRYLPAPTR